MDVQGLAPRLKAITSGDAFDKNGFFQLIKRLWKFNLASLIYLVSEEQHLDQVLEYFFERALPGYVPCTEQVMKTYLAIVSRQLYHETNELYEDYDSDEEEGPNAMPILVKRLKPDPDSNTFENIPSWKLIACDFKRMAERHLKEVALRGVFTLDTFLLKTGIYRYWNLKHLMIGTMPIARKMYWKKWRNWPWELKMTFGRSMQYVLIRGKWLLESTDYWLLTRISLSTVIIRALYKNANPWCTNVIH